MTRDDKEIVSALLNAIAGKVGQKRFDLWFGQNARVEFVGCALHITAPSQFFLDWIRNAFRAAIAEACQETLGACPELIFRLDERKSNAEANAVVQEAAVAKPNAAPVPHFAKAEHAGAVVSAAKASFAGSAHRFAPNDVESLFAASPATAAPQVAAVRPACDLEQFVVGEGNRLAVTSADLVVRQPGQLTPLFLHGPTSVGKSHLLEGICRAARKRNRDLTAVYLSAEQFTSHFLEALRGSGLPNFRRKYRGLHLLVIDDLQFLIGKRATQVELLHTIDALLRERRQLVFSSDRSPAELAELGPELTTRLSGGLVCRIDSPDYVTRLGLVGQFARRMNMRLSPDVQEYVASKLTQHARELSGALCRLQATSEAWRQPITLKMAEEALCDMVRSSGRAVRLGDIEKAVCEVFGLDPQSLQADDKSQRVSHPRMLAMWLARKHTRAALSEIGQYFGRRTHSTVVSAQKRVDRWVTSGESIAAADQTWTVDDAIRQVERSLLAG